MRKSKYLVLAAFVALCLMQIATPVYMAWLWEDVLQRGEPMKWRTAPVDPYDALRGRFIALAFKENKGPLSGDSSLESGRMAYAAVAVNEAGEAVITGVSSQPPAGRYVKVKVWYTQGSQVHVELPFNRYYVPEDIAPAAEKAYQSKAGQDGIAVVRLKNGYGVVEQLYIGGKPLRDYIKQQ